jgi:hypothetical protein
MILVLSEGVTLILPVRTEYKLLLSVSGSSCMKETAYEDVIKHIFKVFSNNLFTFVSIYELPLFVNIS